MSHELAKQIQRTARAHAEAACPVVLATVTATSPLQAEIIRSGMVLDADDLSMTMMFKVLIASYPIQVGSTLLLHVEDDEYRIFDMHSDSGVTAGLGYV